MIKEKKMQLLENYEKLYEELKIKYENKEKENEQLKTLLKLRDKEIISLRKKIKSANNSIDGLYNNNNIHEINKKFLENLIKIEIENILKEQLLFRNKILTLENYELQYLAPKLTTGSNHSYQLSSSKLSDKNLDNLYLRKKFDIRTKSKFYNNMKINNKNKDYLENNCIKDDFKYNTFSDFSNGVNNLILNGSYSKTLTKSKRKFND